MGNIVATYIQKVRSHFCICRVCIFTPYFFLVVQFPPTVQVSAHELLTQTFCVRALWQTFNKSKFNCKMYISLTVYLD